MAVTRRIQHIRGTTAQNNAFTGRSGELSVDTETNELRVHDGSTAGGHRVYTQNEVDALLSLKTTQTDIDTSISALLSALYPVGSVYIGTQNTCPMATLITGSTWVLVSSGRALWTGNGTSSSGSTSNANYANAPANTTIAAGAPSISHTHTTYYKDPGNSSGANGGVGGGSYFGKSSYASASNSSVNAVYGKSSTIQPPAYVVNVWRRTV